MAVENIETGLMNGTYSMSPSVTVEKLENFKTFLNKFTENERILTLKEIREILDEFSKSFPKE